MLDIARLPPLIPATEPPPVESALRTNNGWLLARPRRFLPDLGGVMAHLDGFLACAHLASLFRLPLGFPVAVEALDQKQVDREQTQANLPGLTGSCFARRRTGIRLPHFWHQRACAPIWHLAGPTFPSGRG